MEYALEVILTEIAAKAQAVLGVAKKPAIELANPTFGADYAVPCFAFARELGKSPNQIAIDLAESLQHAAIEKVQPAGGFVNLWLKPTALAKGLHGDTARAVPYGEHNLGRLPSHY
jgi:arginyl-tRNA synthetase